ncbi:MAG: HNH endonuclease signature motif containing protein [Nocardioides sp.]
MVVSRSRTARAARRRRRRVAASSHDLTEEQWAALTQAWGGCAYCTATRTPLQRDCVLPISRGGRYTLDNVVPACRSCNASKCDAEVTGWLRRRAWRNGPSCCVTARCETPSVARFAVDGPG